jgi:lipopolysaccharide export system permease protein
LTTFDRYLLSRYLHIFAVFFIATIGLFAVVDGFMNLDEFHQAAQNRGTGGLFLLMAEHYLYQSALLADLAGPTIIVISAVSVLALMLKNGELHPVLAAGVPTYRVTLPLAIGVLALNGALIANQELILPRIAPKLQGRHGDSAYDAQSVQPTYDPKWWIFVSGQGVIPGEKRLTRPEFILPLGTLVTNPVTLKGENAFFLPRRGDEPGGWLLKNTVPAYDSLPLTDLGRAVLIPQPNGKDLFVSCALTFDQLSRQTSNHRLIGTVDIFRRLQQPSGSLLSRRALLVHLHGRLTRPILTLIGLYLVIPLIVRRDRMSVMQQVTNIATCMATLGIVFGLSMGSQFLGQAGLMRPDQAAWLPLILGGGLAAWLSGVVRT